MHMVAKELLAQDSWLAGSQTNWKGLEGIWDEGNSDAPTDTQHAAW